MWYARMRIPMEVRDQLAARFEVLLPHLNERQQRLALATEARLLGHGGVRLVARTAGVSETTVRKGVFELEYGEEPLPAGRARRLGGGRRRANELYPLLVSALLALVEPDERGDPMSPLRWTTKSLRHLAEELTRQGHRVSAPTVFSPAPMSSRPSPTVFTTSPLMPAGSTSVSTTTPPRLPSPRSAVGGKRADAPTIRTPPGC